MICSTLVSVLVVSTVVLAACIIYNPECKKMFLAALEVLKGQVLHMLVWMQHYLSTPNSKHDHASVAVKDHEGKDKDIHDLLHNMHTKMDHVIEALENNEIANELQRALPASESIASLMHISPIAFIDRHESRGECMPKI